MFGSEWTPIIPAFFTDYLISKRGNLVAKASISRNYRFPSLNDLYFLPGGNPGLKSEQGVAYEAGLIDIDKSDTVYGNDSRMIGYKNVRNRCVLIRMGVNF